MLKTEAFQMRGQILKKTSLLKLEKGERGDEPTKNSSPLSKKGTGQMQKQIICMGNGNKSHIGLVKMLF